MALCCIAIGKLFKICLTIFNRLIFVLLLIGPVTDMRFVITSIPSYPRNESNEKMRSIIRHTLRTTENMVKIINTTSEKCYVKQ